MTRIGLLSDTHGYLDPKLTNLFADCDEIWHAGDIGTLDVIDQLEKFGKPLRMVYGNIDDHKIRATVPMDQVWMVEEMKICMTHIGGYPGRYSSHAKSLFVAQVPDIFVCGHSHLLKVIFVTAHLLLFVNPGACGMEGFHQVKTVLRFTIEGKRAKDMEVIELGKRGSV